MRLVRAAVCLLGAVGMFGETPPIPRPSPPFTAHYPDGGGLPISALKGKVVAVLFVHTTCPHCQLTSKVFSKLYAQYGPRGFEPVAVAFNPMANMLVKDFVRDHQITIPVGYSAEADVLNYLGIPVMERYVVPQIVWIDRKGNIRSQTNAVSGDEKLRTEPYWKEMLETLLKEPAEGGAKTPATSRPPAKKATP
jgi:peroxiredoxin